MKKFYMIGKLIHVIITYVFKTFAYFRNKVYLVWISHHQNVELSGRLIIVGHPIIDIRQGCKLYIEDAVTLNSSNRGYHLNLLAPVKLLADRPGAEIRIGRNTRIHGSCIHAYQLVDIGNNCLIAANCQIFDGNGHDLSFPDVENRVNTKGSSKPIIIEDSVWIGTNSIVLPGVRIGRGSVISASSVVTDDIPTMVVAGGNPARVLKKYST
jgi:acetyltransferase-like isoleucine patch superfamily enzyme